MASPRFLNKVLRLRRTGPCVLTRPGRTNRDLPHRSSLAANRDPHRFLIPNRNHGFLGKGDVIIHRPYLVAGPVGSDWRTRRPSRTFDCEDRSNTT
jgi:hypothetical protein